MKPRIIPRIKVVVIISYIFFRSIPTFAQTSPYLIVNHLQCPIEVTWDIEDGSCLTCNSSGTIWLTASGGTADTYTITGTDFIGGTCSLNPGTCNVRITVQTINSSNFGLPATADISNPNKALPSSGCTGTAPQCNWMSSRCYIDP